MLWSLVTLQGGAWYVFVRLVSVFCDDQTRQALSLTQVLRETRLPEPAGLLLLSPWTDLRVEASDLLKQPPIADDYIRHEWLPVCASW